jgi:triacylglycerol lipase
MPFSNQQAAAFALAVEYAYAMFDSKNPTQFPTPDPRIAKAGWTVAGYLFAKDALMPSPAERAAGAPARLHLGETVFYGYLAQNASDPSVWAAIVRGTADPIEWAIDAEFVPRDYPNQSGATVETGFWDVFSSMQLVDYPSKQPLGAAPAAIAQKIGSAGKVTVVGHSLGSAIVTYLSLETARLIGARASAVMFASPQTGNSHFTAYYDSVLADRYALFNYVLDIVPYVPFSLPLQGINYATLSKATVITPFTSQADVKLDVGCNHSIVSYAAELDYQLVKDEILSQQSDSCLLGPREFSVNEALAELLALAITALIKDKDSLKYVAGKMGWRRK